MLGERARPRRASPTAAARGRVSTLVRRHWPLLLVWVVVGVVGLPTLNFQYGPDQALFAYIGGKIARGGSLYVDVWDVKPPGIFWVYAVLAELPASVRLVRAFDLLSTLLSVAAIYALGTLWWGRTQGALAGLWYGAVYITATGYWNLAQPDGFMVLPAVAGVLVWERAGRTGGRSAPLLAGVLFGIAFQFRSVVALLPLALVLHDLVTARAWRGPLIRAAWLAAGAAAVQVTAMLVLAAGGGLGEYLFAQLRFARRYAALGGPYAYFGFTWVDYLSGLRGGVMWFLGSRLVMSGPALAGLFYGGVIHRDRKVRLCGLLLLAAAISVAVQAKFFIYHWHIVLPFMALLAGWFATEVWRGLRAGRSVRQSLLFATAGVAALLAVSPQITDPGWREWRDIVRYAVQPSYRDTYFDRFGLRNHGTYSYLASLEVSGYIRSRTRPGDTIFVWGYDPNMYLLSGRDSASRFLSLLPLMPVFAPESWKQEFVDDLRARSPAYILLQRGENARWITGREDDSVQWVPQFTAFQALLDERYEFDQRIEDYFIYRLREQAAR